MKKLWKILLILLGFAVFLAALYLLSNQLKTINPQDIKTALESIPPYRILSAMLFALIYYALLGGYDIIAFKHINAKAAIKPKEIFFTCFISNAVGNNTGYSMLFGGSLRYRLYSVYNISMIDVTKVLFFSAATIWLGLFAAGGFIFVFDPVSLAEVTKYNITTRSIGILFLIILISYAVLSSLKLKSVKIFKWNITFPNIKIALAQIALATADWLMASLTLYILMPDASIPYFLLLKVFLVAQLLGILSQVPGGMGVFETSIAMLLPNLISNPAIIGGLLAYRVVFYFFPLSIALLTLGFYEIARLIKKVDEKTKLFGKAVSSILVQVLAVSTFFAGMIAIFSASTPIAAVEIKKIIPLIPNWFLDLSNFLLSVLAAGLLFTARALQLRIKKARKWALVFIALTLLFSIILGESPVVFAYLILLFAALFAAKEYFYRQRSMLNIPFYTWWFCAAGGIFVAAVWAGFFVNKQDITAWFVNPKIFIDALLADGQASRFLRTAIGISVLFVIVVIEEIFRKTFNKLSLFSKDDIYNIVSCSNNSYALNALTGSKNFIVNEDKDAFISYAVAGNNWIALNDPAGNPNKKRELLWQFKEAADRKNALISFVDIRRKYIETYRDIGLDILNIGQEAKIVLKNFSEDNPYFTDLVSSFENEGFVYEIVKSADFEKYKDIFAQINKQWEKDSNYISRNFVPGDYNEEKIIKGMDFSVLKKDGIICGFCILSAVKNKYEASCQIVRYANCSKDAFEYMVYKNVLWAKENEYKFFDLGLTYNNEEGNRIIKYFAQIYAFSEHFNYDFTALREFKNRFNPLWNDKYAAIRFDEHLLMFIRNFTILIYPPKEKKHIRLFFKRFFVR